MTTLQLVFMQASRISAILIVVSFIVNRIVHRWLPISNIILVGRDICPHRCCFCLHHCFNHCLWWYHYHINCQEYLYTRVGPSLMRSHFADWAAHTAAELDYLTREQVRYNVIYRVIFDIKWYVICRAMAINIVDWAAHTAAELDYLTREQVSYYVIRDISWYFVIRDMSRYFVICDLSHDKLYNPTGWPILLLSWIIWQESRWDLTGDAWFVICDFTNDMLLQYDDYLMMIWWWYEGWARLPRGWSSNNSLNCIMY